MAEYIERKALEGSFDAAAKAYLGNEDLLFDKKSVLAGMSIAAGIVHTVPAADVAPVRHGRWVMDGKDHCHCSECKGGRSIQTQIGWFFCPNCGAKMDKEAYDEQ